MQVDVKILSKPLAHRLQSVLPQVIHPSQKGFIKGRSIHHHTRCLSDLQNYCTMHHREGYALFLDFEKAYDRVLWDYLFSVLEKYGVGVGFINWIRLLYKDTKARLIIAGSLQPPLAPRRGVKQGDPLSALLFVLTLEPLGYLIRGNPTSGLRLSRVVLAGLYFADDSTLLSSTVEGLENQFLRVQSYCDGSGAVFRSGTYLSNESIDSHTYERKT